jgi:tetratricopeptide (TPR) repeat protein
VLSSRTAEAYILSPSDRTALPTPSQLERTALSLERKGNLRLLICVVEAWDEVGEPTRPALLAQIRALVELRVVDRAWARIKALLDEPADKPRPPAEEAEVFRLAGRLLIDRGQHKEARNLLNRARQRFPDDLILRELLGRTHDPGTVLDLTDPLEDDPDGQAKIAERLLVEGAPLKARRILERIRKQHPAHTRTLDLLWALEGEFKLRGVTLADLARVHAATPTITDDEGEHTETAGMPHAAALAELEGPDRAPRAEFAGLFKNLDAPTDPGEITTSPPEEPEVTHARALDLLSEVTDRGEEVTATGREDTQIMHVVRTSAPPDATTVDTLVDRPYDLLAERPTVVDSDDPSRAGLDVQGESEDENVVVRRKLEPALPAHDPETGRIRLDTSRDRVQHGVNTSDEAADFVRPRKKPDVKMDDVTPPSAPVRSTPAPEERAAGPRKPTRPPNRPNTPADENPRPKPAPAEARPVAKAVPLEKRTPPPVARRPRLDPELAAAPTVVLEDADEPAGSPVARRWAALAPWTGWLLMLALLGALLLTVGLILVLWQVAVFVG